jgi:hypothetical protein
MMNFKKIYFGLTVILMTGCSLAVEDVSVPETTSSSVNSEIPALPDGAYLLSGVTVTENGQISELKRKQIKIYSNGRFMYAFNNAQTNSIDVGAGDATWSNGIMIEVPRVNHDGPVSGYSFDVDINQTTDGFEQTIIGMKYEDGRILDMVEEWNIASKAVSKYDGLWKLKSRSPSLSDTSEPIIYNETKMIGGGHFIWLNNVSFQNEESKNFGFGTFNIDEKGNAVETAMVSSMTDYEGSINNIKIELIDANSLQQTHIEGGLSITQVYERM